MTAKKARSRGVTLIEVLFSLALLALIVAPMMSVFASSARTTNLAGLSERMDARAAARIEELYGRSYTAALDARAREDGGLLTMVTLSPAGLREDVSGRTACFHIMAGRDGRVRIVTPDGRLVSGDTDARAGITLNGGQYEARLGGAVIQGEMPGSLPPMAAVFAQEGARLNLELKGFPEKACMVYAAADALVEVKGADALRLPGRAEALAYVTAAAHDPAQSLSDAALEAVIPLKLWEDDAR